MTEPTGGVPRGPGDGGTPGDGGGATAAAGGKQTGGVVTKPRPPKVKLMVRTVPAKPKAKVFWGKKLLGETPLQIDRPRDSGPMDLVIKLDDYFPVHTRVYTFHNETLVVKMTKLADRMTLFGAKKELAPEPSPDAPPPTTPVAAPQ